MKAQKVLYIILTWLILPACIVALVWLNYSSVNKPVEFKKEQSRREAVAIQNLKDIRDLQVAYKNTYSVYAPDMDALLNYYDNGFVKMLKQVGIKDDEATNINTEKKLKSINVTLTGEEKAEIDSLAHARAAIEASKAKEDGKARKVKKDYNWFKKKATDSVMTVKKNYRLYDIRQEMVAAHPDKDPQLYVELAYNIPVRDTLLKHRGPDFNVQTLRYVPFTNNQHEVIMRTIVKKVSGVEVPLFEALIPYKDLLSGMDRQLVINLIDDKKERNPYEGQVLQGLMVGNIEMPNNNAGNWE